MPYGLSEALKCTKCHPRVLDVSIFGAGCMVVCGLETPGLQRVSKHPDIILHRSQLGNFVFAQGLRCSSQAVTSVVAAAKCALPGGEDGRHASSEQALRGPEDRVPLCTPDTACEDQPGRECISGGAGCGKSLLPSGCR